ncbi:MAG: ribonuclease P protein component, ribonuclease P protein component [Armatimonadetes bacterium CSP1-3]|nr:MAG: ribonuclease P protein component, ribonuclease P protein component [Armatimonadetes bacterium CSP1-3]
MRLGTPAGRKLGSAVDRNRLRRRLREAFGRVRPMIDRGADVVVVPRGQAMKAPFGELVDALSGALVAAGVIRKDRGEPDSAGEEAVPEP